MMTINYEKVNTTKPVSVHWVRHCPDSINQGNAHPIDRHHWVHGTTYPFGYRRYVGNTTPVLRSISIPTN